MKKTICPGSGETTRVICLGNIAYDIITRRKDNRGGLFFYATPGGSVLNTAVLMSRLGLKVGVAARTGKDFLGETLLKTMKREGINISAVESSSEARTALALAKIDERGDSSYVFYREGGKEAALSEVERTMKAAALSEVFHTGSAYTYDDATAKDTLLITGAAKRSGAVITYDPNWRDTRIKDKKQARKRIGRLLALVDILKLSDADALGITGASSLKKAMRALDREAFVTLGNKGAAYWDGNGFSERVPAFKVKVSDTIGAGDAFTAGLVRRLADTGKEKFSRKIKETLLFASAVSAIVATGTGALGALKSLAQVERFLAASCRLPSACCQFSGTVR
jgi:sugar/nucleoside kinase (ribokinase family)